MSVAPDLAVQCDAARFRILHVVNGEVKQGGLELLDATGGFRWVDLTGQSAPELALLEKRFAFHPLAIEDCSHLDQRAKIEEYGDHLFMVQHGITRGDVQHDLTLHELHAFLGKDYLVTVHADSMAQVDQVFSRAKTEAGLAARGPDYLLYLLSDRIVDSHFLVLDDIAEAIEDLEDAILARVSRIEVAQMFALKRALVALRKAISPARDVMALLAKRGDARVSERTALYFRDVYDHLVRVTEAVEACRDLLGNALDVYLSTAANRTNEIMKQLTLLSVTFLPLTFITGFFGMNFTDIMPFGKHWMFYAMVGSCVALPAGMLGWFLRKSWL